MAKKMCKFNRRTIEGSLGAIYSIVAEPQFVCRSCARVAASSANLCKPNAIPPQSCRSHIEQSESEAAPKPAEQCALLAEAKATKKLVEKQTRAQQMPADDEQVAVIDLVREEPGQTEALKATDDAASESKRADKQVKKQRKALKKQKQLYKKLRKLLRKEQKLTKKRSKLDAHLNEVMEGSFSEVKIEHLH